jgi:hypothetical protein
MPGRREVYPFMGVQFIGGAQGVKLQPVLPIVIFGPDGSRKSQVEAALIDTGADLCLCPSRITKPIGYGIRSGIPISFSGAVGKGTAWRHDVNIAILTHDYRAIFHRLSNVPLHLVQKRSPFPVLLGTRGFLDQFVIHIDYPNNLLTLEVS